MVQLATFYLMDMPFCVNMLLIKEVNYQLSYTSVPKSEEHIRGLLNLRGHIITVFDLGRRLGLGTTDITKKSKNIIFKTSSEVSLLGFGTYLHEIGDETIGIIVDRMGDIIEIEDSQILPVPVEVSENIRDVISGVVSMGDETIYLLDIDSVVVTSKKVK